MFNDQWGAYLNYQLCGSWIKLADRIFRLKYLKV